MLVAIASAAVTSILFALALVHVYWGVAGTSQDGSSAMVPSIDGKPAFRPTSADCYLVAAALAIAGFLVSAQGGAIPSPLPPGWNRVGAAGVGIVFVARAIGDFRLAGFFKKVHGTSFARWDTWLFSPLCLVLGVMSLWIAAA
ncbi:MAG TPA: DUF3995 domain-containing protein [Candidatus Binatia bacterium]|jgi:hypothetical protein